MMSDPRRRSPESSRRRRKARRDSREQATVEDAARSIMMDGRERERRVGSTSYHHTSSPPQQAAADLPPITMRSSDNTPRMPTMSSMPMPMPMSAPLPTDHNRPRPRGTNRRGSGSSSELTYSTSSGSSSSSYLDISRWYPSYGRSGGVLKTFWRTPSEHRPRRRGGSRRKPRKTKPPTIFGFGNNSSSSSVNSDMAYGMGFLKKPRSRGGGFSPELGAVGTVGAAGAAGAAVAAGVTAAAGSASFRRETSDGRPGTLQRRQTDEEIMEIGRKLAEVAKKQNREDLRASGKRPPSYLMGAATTWERYQRESSGTLASGRGLAPSRPDRHQHGYSSDDEEWESASEDGDESDDYSALAYGHAELHTPRPTTSSAAGVSTASARPPRPERKSSVVDPKLFGPANSLRDFVNTPCGFNDGSRAYSMPAPGEARYAGSTESASAEARPLQRVFPLQTSDPGRMEAARGSGSVVSAQPIPYSSSSRPDPIPIQAPKPIVPVPRRILEEEEEEEEEERLHEAEPSEPRERRRRPTKDNPTFAETALVGAGVAGAAALGAAILAGRDKGKGKEREAEHGRDEKYGHEDHRRDETKMDDAKKAQELALMKEIERLERALGKTNKAREQRKRDSMRDSGGRPDEPPSSEGRKTEAGADEARDHEQDRERRRRERQARRGEPSARDSRDADRSFDDSTQRASGDKFDVFAYRVPDSSFRSHDDEPLRAPSPLIIDVTPSPSPAPEQNDRGRRILAAEEEEEEREAKHIYEEAKHATAPLPEAAMAAAIAATEHSRQHRKEEEGRGRSNSRTADQIQEAANQYYHARRVAEREQRSRSRSRSARRERSVVDNYKEDEDDRSQRPPRIVTPPEMTNKPKKNQYSEPNADITFDNMMSPTQLLGYWPEEAPVRDSSTHRPRPVLNLVMPTPVPTPTPEKQQKAAERASDEPQTKAPSVVIGPKGEVVEVIEVIEEPPPTPKTVSWGPSETKQYEIESADEGPRGLLAEKPKSSGKKSSGGGGGGGGGGWGTIAAAIAGASAGAAMASEIKTEPERREERARTDVEENHPSGSRSPPKERPVLPAGVSSHVLVEEPEELPPVPAPKSSSPRSSHMPGAFDEDIDFAATLAAGLEHSGFDPEIVIENPEYRRRDSPPGSNEDFHSTYTHPFAETVSDLGVYGLDQGSRPVNEPGYVIGEVADTPAAERTAPFDDPAVETTTTTTEQSGSGPAPPKLSKKEQRKREKAAKAARLAEEEEAEAEAAARTVPPVEAGEDEWAEAPTSKKSKKSKKSKRASVTWDDGDTPVDESHVSVPVDAYDDIKDADDWDTPKKSKKSKRSSKSFDLADDDPPDRGATSTVSASRYNDGRSNGRSHEDDRSVASAPADSGRKRDSTSDKRSSGGLWGRLMGSSNGDDNKEMSKKDSAGILGAGAGLTGAALAIAALARSDAAEAPREKEEPHVSEDVDWSVRPEDGTSRKVDDILEDPEVAPRVIKPAIDPQFGDLLPLPPSPGEKSSLASAEHDEQPALPALPDSRPATPPGQERMLLHDRDSSRKRQSYGTHSRRPSSHELPPRSPSHTAIPIQFRMSHYRPSSAAASTRSSPVVQSPPTPGQETSPTFKRQPGRPTSWDSSREIKPLYLLEQAGRTARKGEEELNVDVSEPTPVTTHSREAPVPEPELEAVETLSSDAQATPLTIDTNTAGPVDLGSQELTPTGPRQVEHASPVLTGEGPVSLMAEHPGASADSLPESSYATPIGSPSQALGQLWPSEQSGREVDRESSFYGPPQQADEPVEARAVQGDGEKAEREEDHGFFSSALSMLPAAALVGAGAGALLGRQKKNEEPTVMAPGDDHARELPSRDPISHPSGLAPAENSGEVEATNVSGAGEHDDSESYARELEAIDTAETLPLSGPAVDSVTTSAAEKTGAAGSVPESTVNTDEWATAEATGNISESPRALVASGPNISDSPTPRSDLFPEEVMPKAVEEHLPTDDADLARSIPLPPDSPTQEAMDDKQNHLDMQPTLHAEEFVQPAGLQPSPVGNFQDQAAIVDEPVLGLREVGDNSATLEAEALGDQGSRPTQVVEESASFTPEPVQEATQGQTDIVEEAAGGSRPPSPLDDEWATIPSKKSKKNKKKKKQSVSLLSDIADNPISEPLEDAKTVDEKSSILPRDTIRESVVAESSHDVDPEEPVESLQPRGPSAAPPRSATLEETVESVQDITTPEPPVTSREPVGSLEEQSTEPRTEVPTAMGQEQQHPLLEDETYAPREEESSAPVEEEFSWVSKKSKKKRNKRKGSTITDVAISSSEEAMSAVPELVEEGSVPPREPSSAIQEDIQSTVPPFESPEIAILAEPENIERGMELPQEATPVVQEVDQPTMPASANAETIIPTQAAQETEASEAIQNSPKLAAEVVPSEEPALPLQEDTREEHSVPLQHLETSEMLSQAPGSPKLEEIQENTDVLGSSTLKADVLDSDGPQESEVALTDAPRSIDPLTDPLNNAVQEDLHVDASASEPILSSSEPQEDAQKALDEDSLIARQEAEAEETRGLQVAEGNVQPSADVRDEAIGARAGEEAIQVDQADTATPVFEGQQPASQEGEDSEEVARREADSRLVQEEKAKLARLQLKRNPSKKDKQRIKALKASVEQRERDAEAAAQRQSEEQPTTTFNLPQIADSGEVEPGTAELQGASSMVESDSRDVNDSKESTLDISSQPQLEDHGNLDMTGQLLSGRSVSDLPQDPIALDPAAAPQPTFEDTDQLPKERHVEHLITATQDEPDEKLSREVVQSPQSTLESSQVLHEGHIENSPERLIHRPDEADLVDTLQSQIADSGDSEPNVQVGETQETWVEKAPASEPTQEEQEEIAAEPSMFAPEQTAEVEAQPEAEWFIPRKLSKKDKKKKRKGTLSGDSTQTSGMATPQETHRTIVPDESTDFTGIETATLPPETQRSMDTTNEQIDSSQMALSEQEDAAMENGVSIENSTSSTTDKSTGRTQDVNVDRIHEDLDKTPALEAVEPAAGYPSWHSEADQTPAPELPPGSSTVVEQSDASGPSFSGLEQQAVAPEQDPGHQDPERALEPIQQVTSPSPVLAAEDVRDNVPVEADETSRDAHLEEEPVTLNSGEPQEPRDDEFSWIPSKKSKKDKKKKRGKSWTEPEPDSGAQTPNREDAAEPSPATIPREISTSEEAPTTTQIMSQDPDLPQPSGPQQMDDWSAAPIKKSKKDKKKKKWSSVSSWEPENSTQSPVDDKAREASDPVEVPTSGQEVVDATLSTEPVETLAQSPVASESILTRNTADENVPRDSEKTANESALPTEEPSMNFEDVASGEPVTKLDLESRARDGDDTFINDEEASQQGTQTTEPASLSEPVREPDVYSQEKEIDALVGGAQVADEAFEPLAAAATHDKEVLTKSDLDEKIDDGENTLIVAGGENVDEAPSPLQAAQDNSDQQDLLSVEESAVRPQSPVPWEGDDEIVSPERKDDSLDVQQSATKPDSPTPWEDNKPALLSSMEEAPVSPRLPDSTLVSEPREVQEEAPFEFVSARKSKKDKKNRKRGSANQSFDLESPSSNPASAIPSYEEAPERKELYEEDPPETAEAAGQEAEKGVEPTTGDFGDWIPKKLSKKEKRKAKKGSMTVDEPEDSVLHAEEMKQLPTGDVDLPVSAQEARDVPVNSPVMGIEEASRPESMPKTLEKPLETPEQVVVPDSNRSPDDTYDLAAQSLEPPLREMTPDVKQPEEAEKSGVLHQQDWKATEEPALTEAPVLNRKMSKKEKRKAKKKAASSWEEDAFEIGESPDPLQDVTKQDEPGPTRLAAEAETTQEQPGDPSSPTRSQQDQDDAGSWETPTATEAVAEEEWTAPLSRKKTVKDKKKKGKQIAWEPALGAEATSTDEVPSRERTTPEPDLKRAFSFVVGDDTGYDLEEHDDHKHGSDRWDEPEEETRHLSVPVKGVQPSLAEASETSGGADVGHLSPVVPGTELQRVPSNFPSPDIWDNEDYFKPKALDHSGGRSPEESFDKVDIYPGLTRGLDDAQEGRSKDDRPLVGLGLIHRHSSIFQEDDRHSPKLLTMAGDNVSVESIAVEEAGPWDRPTRRAPDATAPELRRQQPKSSDSLRSLHGEAQEASTSDTVKQIGTKGSVALLAEKFGGSKKGNGPRPTSFAHGRETQLGDDNVSVTNSPPGQDAGRFTPQLSEQAEREEEIPLEPVVVDSADPDPQVSSEPPTTESEPADHHSPDSQAVDTDTMTRSVGVPTITTTDTNLEEEEPRGQLHDLPTPRSASPVSAKEVGLGLLEESALPTTDVQDQDDSAPDNFFIPAVDFRRSVSRGLPPVQEDPQEDEAEADKQAVSLSASLGTPDFNRDSGFVTDSPAAPWLRRFQDAQQRDSGVHLRDYPDGSPMRDSSREVSPDHQQRLSPSSTEEDEGAKLEDRLKQSPRSDSENNRRLCRENTPVLGAKEPPVTPEPQKTRGDRSRPRKNYPDLGPGATAATAAILAGGGEAALLGDTGSGATSPAPPTTPAAGQRSISDNAIKRQASTSPHGTPPSQRRALSNTSISRARTPEPLNLRADSPGLLRRQHSGAIGAGTPPLRSRRTRSGDLRSLSQSSQRSHSDLGAPTSPSPRSPVALGQAPLTARSPTPATASNTPVPASSSSTSNSDLRRATTIPVVALAAVGAAAAATAAAAAAAAGQPSTNNNPVANEGRVRAKDMADVYDGFGEGRLGSPRSPTRPHSMRRRQSMQVLELESRVDQLIAENRALTAAKNQAELHSTNRATSVIAERDNEIETLKQSLEFMRKEVQRLTEVNEGLNSAIAQTAVQHESKYRLLESQHAEATRELNDFRGHHGSHARSLEEKDAEIRSLREELEATKEQIREMQRQILATKPADSDFLEIKDVDYFDHRCQQLCSHVQQWVLRFSKFSDMRACRLTSELNDEKIIDRLDNAVLDGSNVDHYLNDRVKRRDIFMSVTMTMIWEFVFTRYLFGMDREQRQKLKALEKLLLEVGPPRAVRQWRAVTLTLLAKRDAFEDQRDQDTEAVVQAVFQTLSMILPPPSNLEDQIQGQLRKVMREAVDLSIQMRTQRAEYMMLPPLQPEYDANGDLAEPHHFNPTMMTERSAANKDGDAEDLQAEGAIVRAVLFPLVVKKGDDDGVGDDEIVVCPALVIVAKPRSASRRSMRAPSSDAGGVSLLRGGGSPSTAPNRSNVSMQEAEYFEGGI